MSQLSRSFIENCRVENGCILRGENMTRIETFVDAAFAFAVTMLVISLDEIPTSASALFETSRDIPAFIMSGFMIGLIWHKHSKWSRQYGLEDVFTVILSLCLVMLVLIFIYPLKLVFMGLASWLSDGYLSPHLGQMNLTELSNLFIYFAVGFLSLSAIFYLLNINTLKRSEFLILSDYEVYTCRTENMRWISLGITALISMLLAKVLPGLWVTSAGFIYFFQIFISKIIIEIRVKNEPSKNS